MPKRILLVTPSGYPLGGVATWLDYLARGLEESGWRPVLGLVAGEHHNPDVYLREHPFDAVEIIHAPTGTVEGRVRALARTIRRVRPDLVASVNIPDVFRAVNRLRRRGDKRLRVIMTLHGLQPGYFHDVEAFRALLDGVVCTNRLTCELAERIGGMDPSRVFNAPYGVEAQRTSEERETTDGGLRILYCGRFDQDQKRVLDLPKILSALDELSVTHSLTLAGGGPLEAELRAKLAPWLETGRVGFAGSLDSRALADEYHKADVLLITSSWETGPIVAWEAMAEGVPVVSSRFLGSGLEGALIEGENCLLFPPGDTAAAARSLARLWKSRDLGQRLTRNGRKLVLDRYSRSRSVDHWEQALGDVLARPPLGATDEPPPIAPSGRLDRLFGARAAESVRCLLRRRFTHPDQGGEWPHSYGDPSTTSDFLRLAQELDTSRPETPAHGGSSRPATVSATGKAGNAHGH